MLALCHVFLLSLGYVFIPNKSNQIKSNVSLVELPMSLCSQVQQRAAECVRALDKLFEINAGMQVDNVLKSQFDWTTLEVRPHHGRHGDLVTVATVISRSQHVKTRSLSLPLSTTTANQEPSWSPKVGRLNGSIYYTSSKFAGLRKYPLQWSMTFLIIPHISHDISCIKNKLPNLLISRHLILSCTRWV